MLSLPQIDAQHNARLRNLAWRYAELAQQLMGENLTSVVLYGSVARGEAHRNSDIDLLIVTRTLPNGAFRRQSAVSPIRDRLLPDLEALWDRDCYVDFSEVIKTEEEAKRFHKPYLDMTEEGVILYDRGGFFAGVLERLRSRLKELGARRRTVGRIVYWDLKPDFEPGEAFDI